MPQISIIKKSELEGAIRIDPEYYKREYLEKDKILKNTNSKKLIDISNSIINFGAYSLCSQIEYKKRGVPFLQVGNIKDNFIAENFKYIDEKLSKTILHKSLVKENQVLITIAGTIGNAVVAQNLPKNTNSNQAIANITLKKEINPFYISTFLNSKFGKYQSKRLIISNVQPNLLLVQVKSIKIPILPKSFQLQIEKIVKSAYRKQTKSKQLYKEAEEILLEELGLLDYEPENVLTFEAMKKEADEAKRIDAEYFQPKYEEIIKKIEDYQNGFDIVGNLGKFTNGSFISDKYYIKQGKKAYIRIKELSFDKSLEKEQMIFINNNFKYKNETIVEENDFVFATIGNTIGKVNLITKEFSGSFSSNNTSKFRLYNIENSFYYELLFRSKIFQDQIQRKFTQTAQPKISNNQLGQIKIPIIKSKIQKQIAKRIQKSHILRKESRELLEEAKKRVEQEIEKNLN